MKDIIQWFGLACFVAAGLLSLSPYYIMAYNELRRKK